MKRAIVLSGGGAKGAYQIGFWKAIRELGITYDIVTGTSIGALNGAYMVQGNYNDAFKLWYFMDYGQVLDSALDASFNDLKGKKEIILKYAKGAIKGGINALGLENIIKKNLRPDLFYSSSVDYGLVTVKFPSLKPVMLTKKEIKEELLPDYLLASAACFPAFKMKEINNESYIDGGYYDNMPIDLAVKLGADEIIAVDLRAPGKRKKIKNVNAALTIISSKNEIGNFLVLEKEQARRLIKLGYNDTMKTFDKLEGNYFTFKKGSLKRNFDRINERFYNNLATHLKQGVKIGRIKRLYGKNNLTYFNQILENLMKAFNLDDTKIYRTSFVNVLIRKAYNKEKSLSFSLIKKMIKENKFTKNFVNKEIICYIYDELLAQKSTNKVLNNLMLLFPDSYLCAMYLKTIMR